MELRYEGGKMNSEEHYHDNDHPSGRHGCCRDCEPDPPALWEGALGKGEIVED